MLKTLNSFFRAFKRNLNKYIYITKSLTSADVNVFGYDIYFSPQLETSLISTVFLSQAKKLSLLPSDLRLLDIGCGSCKVAAELSKYYNLSYTGLDLGNSSDYLSRASFNLSSLNSFSIHTSLLSDYTPSSQFDVILCSHFLEHQSSISHTIKTISGFVNSATLLIYEFPLPHRLLIGGHLSLLTPSLLAYNHAKVGIDCRASIGFTKASYGFFAVFLSPASREVSSHYSENSLIWDVGELEQLSSNLPPCIIEGADIMVNWNTLDSKYSKCLL